MMHRHPPHLQQTLRPRPRLPGLLRALPLLWLLGGCLTGEPGESAKGTRPRATSPTDPLVISPEVLEHLCHGQEVGQSPAVLAKVGDSYMDTGSLFLYPLVQSGLALGDHPELQETVDTFRDSFARDTSATITGHSARSPQIWTGMNAEYDARRPGVAFILFHMNDMNAGLSPETYRADVQRLVDETLRRGIVPVLFTLPVNRGGLIFSFNYDVGRAEGYNEALRQIARDDRRVILRELSPWVESLYGPSGGFNASGHFIYRSGAADLSALESAVTPYLQWNFLALQTLHALQQARATHSCAATTSAATEPAPTEPAPTDTAATVRCPADLARGTFATQILGSKACGADGHLHECTATGWVRSEFTCTASCSCRDGREYIDLHHPLDLDGCWGRICGQASAGPRWFDCTADGWKGTDLPCS